MLLKTCALETIDTYPASSIHAYTDGSAFKATKNAGFGILLEYPNGTVSETSDCCGANCSNYEAEVLAITTAIQIIHQAFELTEQQPADIVVFSDSKSALEALQNPPYNHREVAILAQTVHCLLASYDVQVNLQWIPGHSDVKGNEKADKLAKSGAAKPQKNTTCTLTTVQRILKQNEKEDWLNRWACGSTGRILFQDMSQPRPKDAINFLNRADQSLIFQFRTQHARTNYHLNRINPLHEPNCRLCFAPYEIPQHILLQCPMLSERQRELLPPNPILQTTLSGPLGQFRKTCTFIRLALAAKE